MTGAPHGTPFGAEYYAGHAERLGWGPSHAPDGFKLSLLREHVRGDTVLDVGCGPGVYAAALAREGLRVVGIDFSRELLRAGHPEGRGWRALCASAFALPLRDRAVDTTLLLSILEHVDDAALLREAARVTRARIIIQVPLTEPPLLPEAGLIFSHWMDRSHVRTYTEASLRTLVAAAGCRVVVYVPAYRRNLHELYLRGLAVPRLVSGLVGAMLGRVRRFALRPPAEAFAVLEKA